MADIRTRKLADVHGVRRGAGSSAWRTHRHRPAMLPITLAARVRSRFVLLTTDLLAWGWNYFRYIFRPRCRFVTYEDLSRRHGTESAKDPVHRHTGIIGMEGSTIALAGDWGSGTDSAYRVADRIRRLAPDYTIHLGDVYYSGTESEFGEYFLPAEAWPRGAKGTFALNGNHEMYSGGRAYFRSLTREPMTHMVKGDRRPQNASYFCLENDHWRILAIDTGYYSKSFPVLELFDTYLIRLHKAIQTWLREVVFADPDDRRPVLLLSHHEWFSAYDSEYTRMGSQIAPYLDRVLLWFWGHEHRFTGYAPFGLGDGPKVRARCIGHGGIPFDIAYPHRHRNLVFSDERISAGSTNAINAKQQLGYCGFAFLKFSGPKLTVSYYDEGEDSAPLLEETWTCDKVAGIANGEVSGGSLLAKYEDGDPGVPPRRVADPAGENRLKALGGTWRYRSGRA